MYKSVGFFSVSGTKLNTIESLINIKWNIWNINIYTIHYNMYGTVLQTTRCHYSLQCL